MRENSVHLNGIVANNPVIRHNDEGESFGSLRVCCINNTKRSNGRRAQGKVFHYICVKSYDKDIVDVMSRSAKGDLVFVEGVISTEKVFRKYHCNECGEDSVFDGVFTYVTPKEFHITERRAVLDSDGNWNNDLANEILMTYRESSNVVKIAGYLPRDPAPFKINKELGIAKGSYYQICGERKYKVPGDEENKEDWPYIHAYGSNSKIAQLYLGKDSCVLVDGYLDGHTYTKKTTCQHCGKEILKKCVNSIIVAYSQEFVSGIKDPNKTNVHLMNASRIPVKDENDAALDADPLTPEEIEAVKAYYAAEKAKYALPDEPKKKTPENPDEADKPEEPKYDFINYD